MRDFTFLRLDEFSSEELDELVRYIESIQYNRELYPVEE